MTRLVLLGAVRGGALGREFVHEVEAFPWRDAHAHGGHGREASQQPPGACAWTPSARPSTQRLQGSKGAFSGRRGSTDSHAGPCSPERVHRRSQAVVGSRLQPFVQHHDLGAGPSPRGQYDRGRLGNPGRLPFQQLQLGQREPDGQRGLRFPTGGGSSGSVRSVGKSSGGGGRERRWHVLDCCETIRRSPQGGREARGLEVRRIREWQRRQLPRDVPQGHFVLPEPVLQARPQGKHPVGTPFGLFTHGAPRYSGGSSNVVANVNSDDDDGGAIHHHQHLDLFRRRRREYRYWSGDVGYHGGGGGSGCC
ncbi:unnamed protein product [Ectocarpus fasciculatus]